MSEQKTAKESAYKLRLAAGNESFMCVMKDAASELDRLADLCEVLTAERDTARSATASMLRRRDTVANELRCQCQALAAERDAMRAQVTTLAAERDDWAALVGKLREEVARLTKSAEEARMVSANARASRDAAMTNLQMMTSDRNALAEGVRAYRQVLQPSGSLAGLPFVPTVPAVRAWERQHGHRAEPARKSDEVEEKPPLLDLRTLPVGTVCEAVGWIGCPYDDAPSFNARSIQVGQRFTLLKHACRDDRTMVGLNADASEWMIAPLQPAHVISTPKPAPAPEPYRMGIPALALRHAHGEWDASDGCTLRFIDATRYEVVGRYQDKIEGKAWNCLDMRPHATTWAEVELKAARLLGSEAKRGSPCMCGLADCMSAHWLRSELGITDPTRDMTALWAAFREGQKS